jgi:hypothetical protein
MVVNKIMVVVNRNTMAFTWQTINCCLYENDNLNGKVMVVDGNLMD